MLKKKKKELKMTYTERDGVRRNIRYFEFDCPLCDANNPYDEGFKAGEEVLCYYCGTTFRVRSSSEGELKLIQV